METPGTIGWSMAEATTVLRSLDANIPADIDRVATLVQRAYNVGLTRAREELSAEAEHADSDSHRKLLLDVSTCLLHAMICDGEGDPI